MLSALTDDGPVAAVLNRLGVTTEQVRIETERILRPGASGAVSGRLPLTPRAESSLKLAAEEARMQGDSAIAPGQLLVGLALEGEGVAAHILSNLGVTVPAVRQALSAPGSDPSH